MADTIELIDELHQNFIDFSYEANSERAFADARDGLKPGQRACLWEMYDKGYSSSKPHVKSAKISGGVIANWWPHGDQAIYDTFARMSQSWINNIPEVSWHGANGSQIISGEAAAPRYTEARLSKFTEDGLMYNIKKHNVPMIKNFSEDAEWPEVLPAIVPRLMINGCQGIGVTIANVWLPHSLKDLYKVIIKYINEGILDYSDLAPSFPSGGIIINKDDIHKIYETGKGKVILRAKTEIKGNSIFITEFPYQVYIEPWMASVKKLVADNVIDGIEKIYNRSNQKGLCVEVECSGNPNHILNQLFQETDLQSSYNANQFALVGKTPKLLTLKEYLDIYIKHNLACISKETEYDLNKAKARQEIVLGLIKAVEDIDNIIALIKKSDSAAAAQSTLIARYNFTENQAHAIVEMKLGRLAHLESIELNEENKKLTSTIESCNDILTHETKQKEIFIERLTSVTKKYGEDRRTQVTQINLETTKKQKEVEEVIPKDVVVVVSKTGDVKRIAKANFKTQKRNGKGVKSIDDVVLDTISTNTIDTLMIFTNKGKMYRILVDKIPEGTNASKGQNLASLVALEPNEKVNAVTSLHRETNAEYVVFFTKNGLIKKSNLSEYTGIKRNTGIQAIKLKENDEIVSVTFLKDEPVIVVSKNGYAIKFETTNISTTGRNAAGVKAINLASDDYVMCGRPISPKKKYIALITIDGNGKKIKLDDINTQARGGKGVIISKSDHALAGAAIIGDNDKILVRGIPNSICLAAEEIPTGTRIAIGNLLINNSKPTGLIKL